MAHNYAARKCSWPTEQELLRVAGKLIEEATLPTNAATAVRVPYRVCPLGAHVDHQGGCISGMALDFGVTLVFVPRSDRNVLMTSRNFSGTVSFSLDDVPPCRRSSGPDEENCWGNFPRGAVRALQARKHRLQNGLSGVLLAPEQLDSSGISSSAAVGIACLLALEHANGLRLSIAENVELDRLIENEYLGLKNGIMDQSIVLGAFAGLLTLVDCRTGTIQQHTPPWVANGGECPYAILLAFSGMRSALAAAPDFNNRVSECHAAAELLLRQLGRPEQPHRLGEVTQEEWQQHRHILGDTALGRRAEHFFSETARVRQGAWLWQAGDVKGLGQLMNLSGRSSAVNYEVGSEQLRVLQGLLQSCEGVYGARFSGAGTRGACVALVEADAADRIAIQVLQGYSEKFPQLVEVAQVIVSTSADGARFVALH